MKTPLSLLLAPLLASAALFPGAARAYTVLAPGELLRMDAMIVWEAQQEVLLLSPVVRGGGTLVLPLPAGARLLETRPEAPEWLGVAPEAPGGEPAFADGGVEGDGRVLDRELAPRATKANLGDREAPRPADALGLGRSPDEGPPPMARAGKILLVPASRVVAALESAGTPRPGPEAEGLLRGAPMVLIAALPRDPIALRVAPIAVALDSVWPGIPLAEDPKIAPHPLTLRLLGAGPARDLGGMDFAYGLKAAAGESEVPVSLMAWLEGKLARPGLGWQSSHFAAGAMDPRKASAARLTDLRLPPPPGSKKKRRAATASPPAAAPVADEEIDSCAGCASSGGGELLSGLLLLGFGLRRRLPR